ncbi:export protein for polysaccharides and teichoic acids [Streptococcus equi subsp. zooepidemicus MGCS10565]|uniref:Export protein for polysaccharides and teichoic acids n=1 Tax=Streptococcus equi subsp. zooepidemicus (strain MGCS10565) TaxID=552526 RepID=B4U4N0_STREM|nr:polysaccharide biosynthesis protein [Streptococcus equi]ACG62947.1 export protein for polysaccharides and teichoic acids [Streptococcus equi subsp. zooepidemicus MGCS10565]MDI6035257.1 polysaccharide biosynthesis protein [Streptococcus equi subsp. zooepidemicus]QZA20797.1 polysaccharide biosynthesis protein [Streptococcus equi subsp. zooepidemicus]SQF54607.1 polysaccharide biosynthesis protein [Streptococcus equi subsp. zooepidemicus]HEL0657003.1 polysaccharide biosynthesis protein [Strepto
MSTEKKQLTQEQLMVQGAAWSTAGNFISRLLGVLYIIPWYIWMGQYAIQANALFNMGYNVYAYFLLISTTGLNVAIAKQVAKYNSMGQQEHSYQLIRSTLKVMLVLGLVFSVLMYLGSPLFARLSGGDETLVPIMHSLSLAVFVFPVMSVIRGIFQGYKEIKPYALSQIAEQLVRVIWMLLTTFFIMKMGSKDYIAAVTQSTFAAFIGMIASMAVLFYYFWTQGLLKAIFTKTEHAIPIDIKGLLIETLKESIPFIITGSAIQAFQLIDQWTFVNTMTLFTNYTRSQLWVLFGYFNANPAKITMVLIAVAASIGSVGIALLTENYVKKDMRAAARLIINNIEMLLMFLLPALTGAIILARPLYTVFYGSSEEQAVRLFVAVLCLTLLMALYTLFSPMLQALFENRKAIYYFAYGVFVKLVLQVPLIYLFHAYGPLLATTLGLLVPIYLMYRRLHQVTQFNRKLLHKRILLTVIETALMGLIVLLANWLLGYLFKPTGRLTSLLYLVIIGGLGMGVYAYMTLVTRQLDKLIGSRAARYRQKLGL